jgi:hypothetical protein
MVGRTGSLSVICLQVSDLGGGREIRWCSYERLWMINQGRGGERRRVHDLCFQT